MVWCAYCEVIMTASSSVLVNMEAMPLLRIKHAGASKASSSMVRFVNIVPVVFLRQYHLARSAKCGASARALINVMALSHVF